MDWDDARYVLALARSGSVRGAGSALGVSHSTVARRVEALEERLCVRLFDRNRDGFLVTDAGREMVQAAERVEREMAALERTLMGQDEKLAGPVHLTCCDEFVSGMLIGDLRKLCDRHPDIELRISTDSRPFDLSKREADLAVRILAVGSSPPEHLIGRKLGPIMVANYVGREHVAQFDPEVEGSEPRWIGFEERRLTTQQIAASSYPDLAPWGWFSSVGTLIQATAAGFGIAMLPTYAADTEPGIRRLTNADLRHLADIWLLCHPDLRDNARLMATRSCVVEAFRRREPLFAGLEPVS